MSPGPEDDRVAAGLGLKSDVGGRGALLLERSHGGGLQPQGHLRCWVPRGGGATARCPHWEGAVGPQVVVAVRPMGLGPLMRGSLGGKRRANEAGLPGGGVHPKRSQVASDGKVLGGFGGGGELPEVRAELGTLLARSLIPAWHFFVRLNEIVFLFFGSFREITEDAFDCLVGYSTPPQRLSGRCTSLKGVWGLEASATSQQTSGGACSPRALRTSCGGCLCQRGGDTRAGIRWCCWGTLGQGGF